MPAQPSSQRMTNGAVYGALIILLVFTVTLLGSAQLGAGWWWDIAGGLGFLALAFLVLLNLATGQGPRLASHKMLGWWAVGLSVAHAGVYLVTDSAVVAHLRLAAPPAMLVGVAALVVSALGASISLTRWKLRVHGSRENFRRYHRLMSWSVLLGCLYHIAVTSHSMHQQWQLLLIGGGVLLLLLVAKKVSPRLSAQTWIAPLLLFAFAALSCFVVLRNV